MGVLALLIASALGTQPHYGQPPCRSDEMMANVSVVPFGPPPQPPITYGVICAPRCHNWTCPTDAPRGTTAQIECMFEDIPQGSGINYCGLQCFNNKTLKPNSTECPGDSICNGVFCMWPANSSLKVEK